MHGIWFRFGSVRIKIFLLNSDPGSYTKLLGFGAAYIETLVLYMINVHISEIYLYVVKILFVLIKKFNLEYEYVVFNHSVEKKILNNHKMYTVQIVNCSIRDYRELSQSPSNAKPLLYRSHRKRQQLMLQIY